ncbi:MAG: GspE/PulE/PilB domain-containing protein [Ktedonobacteraceae bacterium]
MSNTATAPLIQGLAIGPSKMHTIQDIVSIAKQILSTGVEQIAFVTVHLSYEINDAINAHQKELADKTTQYLLTDLRVLVRKTDSILYLGHNLYFLLHGANKEGGKIVQDRLWEALLWRVHNLSERDMMRPQSLATGHSAYPMRNIALHDCITTAEEAMFRFETQSEKEPRKYVEAAQDLQPKDELDQELPALARKLGIPYLTLLPRKLPQSLQHLVNPKLAHELHCYPLGRERNMLTVAMLNPVDHSALDRLKQETGLHIFPVLTHPQALQVALEQLV